VQLRVELLEVVAGSLDDIVAAAMAASARAVTTPPWMTPSGLPSSARAAISYVASPRLKATRFIPKVLDTGERSSPHLVFSNSSSTTPWLISLPFRSKLLTGNVTLE
jgi:hypothetical protein